MARNHNTLQRSDGPEAPVGGGGQAHDLASRRHMNLPGIVIALVVLIAPWFIVWPGWGRTISDAGWLFIFGGMALCIAILFVVAIHAQPNAGDLALAIDAAQAFDLAPATATYRARFGLSEAEALRHEREFRRWVALASLLPSPVMIWPARSTPLSNYRDEVAGEHRALFGALCAALPGGHPALALKWTDGAAEGRPFASFILAYRFAYGEAPDPGIWPVSTYHLLESWQTRLAEQFPGDPRGTAVRALMGHGHEDTSG